MGDLLDKATNGYTTWLGQRRAFKFCLGLNAVGAVPIIVAFTALENANFEFGPHVLKVSVVCGMITIIVNTISQNVIQLLSLPALQIAAVEAEAQRQNDQARNDEQFRTILEIAQDTKEMHEEVHEHFGIGAKD